MQHLFVLVVLSVIVWSCNSSEKDSHDLFLIKVKEQLFYNQLEFGLDKNEGESASSYRNRVLKPMFDTVKEDRKGVRITDKLRDVNVIMVKIVITDTFE